MKKAYDISVADCGCYYFENADEKLFCQHCDSYIGDETYCPSSKSVRKLKNNFGFTYDNKLLLTEKAKFFLENREVEGLEFIKFNQDPKIYCLLVNRYVGFDTEIQKPCYENFCQFCGNYESITGPDPIYLVNDNIKKMGFYRSDIEFGSGRSKAPLYIVGEDLYLALKKEFKELDFSEVNYADKVAM